MRDPEPEKKTGGPNEEYADSARQYTLSEAQLARFGRALVIIGQLAPTLGEAELRTLIALTRLFGVNDPPSGRISSRALAEHACLSRANVKTSLHSLAEKNIIATRGGTATMPSAHVLTFMRTIQMGGITVSPPPGEIHRSLGSGKSQGGIEMSPPPPISVEKVGSFQAQGGLIPGPPLAAGQGDAGARVDSIDLKLDIDRLRAQGRKTPDEDSILLQTFGAKPRDWSAGELEQAKRWVHGYQCDKGDKYKADPQRNRNPPDDTVLSQILMACGSLGGLINFVQLMDSRREAPGSKYAWYVTTALEIYHGIRPEKTKQARAQLRIASRPSPPAITGEQQPLIEEQKPDPEFARELVDELNRKRKGVSR
jgi:hypothetical protein